jgi:hypothetical protein
MGDWAFLFCEEERQGVGMKSLQVLVCGGDGQALQKVAQRLSDEGADQLCRTDQEWDLLLVDLDAMTSLLRGVLPAVRHKFPHLSMLGIVNGSPLDIGYLSYDLELDGYTFGPPRPEDLIVRLPHLAANYLCETNTFYAFSDVTARAFQELAV